ncbi:MAG: CPBP family intramembrane metalloprotease, partial [Spirochaetaceae bacterium]|nr:CPBP family intramembrane metalloprotease [Spirochaetaceae bacterium]
GFAETAVHALAAFMPTAAVIILLRKYGAIGERRTIWQFIGDFPKRVSPYLIILAFMVWRFLVFFIAGDLTNGQPLYMLFLFLLMQVFQGGLEEPGWRGFLQPWFDKRLPFVVSVVLVSVIWSVWHIPLWFVAGSAQSEMSFVIFFLQILVNSCSLAAIMKTTKSVAFCILYHAWCNAVFLLAPFEMNGGIVTAYAVEGVVAMGIGLLFNKRA